MIVTDRCRFKLIYQNLFLLNKKHIHVFLSFNSRSMHYYLLLVIRREIVATIYILLSDFISMASTPIHVKILMFAGQIVLAFIYGTFGTILTFLLFVRSGPKKFFRRVERSTPPAQATDPIYGKHEMIKLKVNRFLSLIL